MKSRQLCDKMKQLFNPNLTPRIVIENPENVYILEYFSSVKWVKEFEW